MKRKRQTEKIRTCISKGLDLLEVPSLLPTHEWAAQKRIMPTSVTAKPGPYSCDITPWAKAAQEDFDDPAVQTTVFCWAARLSKTESFLNLIGRTVDIDPSNIIICYPTLEAVKVFFAESVQPMFASSKCFRGKISNPRKRDGANTQRTKRFPGGSLRGIGANVPSAFRGVQAKIVIGDEIDAMEIGKEGDPIDLLFKRSENYPDAIQVLSSTPTVVGTSRIWSWLENSDFQKWFVPSPHCDEWHVLDWANLKWPSGQPEDAYYEDPFTGKPWTDEQRREMVMAGEWRATKEFRGIRGRWVDGMVSLFAPKKGYKNKLHQFASEFLQAKENGIEALQVWHNTFRALPWEEESESVEHELVAARAEHYDTTPLPDRVLFVTLAADVQDDRIEFEWVGWGENFESWGLLYGVIPGDTKRPAIWEKFDAEIRREWKVAGGGSLKMARGFIDEGHSPQMVRPFCLRQLQQNVMMYPSKGIGRNGVVEPELVSFKSNKQQKGIKAPTWNVGTTKAKRVIYAHLLSNPPGPNTMHFPIGHGYDSHYFEMLTSEKVATKYSYGKPYKVFECPKGVRNEALDIRVYGYAAAYSLNPSWDHLRQALDNMRKSKPASVEPQNKLTPTEDGNKQEENANIRRRNTFRGGGFVNSF
jgi:phage terminase large subunit GpA-like protein